MRDNEGHVIEVLQRPRPAAGNETWQRTPPRVPLGAGTEHLRWVEGRITATLGLERHLVNVEDGLWLTMADGVRLEARLFRPRLPTAQGPALLVSNGYGRDSPIGAAFDIQNFDFASRGYAVLHVSLRGSGQSEGINDLYGHYGEDGAELVEWLARQPWCDGQVGMVGASLLGISQWLTAKQAPPHLRAIVPHVACGDAYRYLWCLGGMLPGPGRAARSGVEGVVDEYASAMAHRDLDAWWRDRGTLADDHRAIAERGVAAFITGGFHDYLTPANIRAFEEYGGPEATKRLLIGPWAHGLAPQFVQELTVEFLDHHLRGIDNGVAHKPPVLIHVDGVRRWRYEDAWPLPHETRARLFLSAETSGSIASLNDGSLTTAPSVTATSAAIGYSPDAGPFLPLMLSADRRSPNDQSPTDAGALTWTSPILDQAVEITGYANLTLWVSASAPDADLVAHITDVAPDGSSRQIVQGYANLPRIGDPSTPRPLTPGQVARYDIQLLPIAYVLPAGHRLRLAIAGGAEPGAGQLSPQGPGKNVPALSI